MRGVFEAAVVAVVALAGGQAVENGAAGYSTLSGSALDLLLPKVCDAHEATKGGSLNHEQQQIQDLIPNMARMNQDQVTEAYKNLLEWKNPSGKPLDEPVATKFSECIQKGMFSSGLPASERIKQAQATEAKEVQATKDKQAMEVEDMQATKDKQAMEDMQALVRGGATPVEHEKLMNAAYRVAGWDVLPENGQELTEHRRIAMLFQNLPESANQGTINAAVEDVSEGRKMTQLQLSMLLDLRGNEFKPASLGQSATLADPNLDMEMERGSGYLEQPVVALPAGHANGGRGSRAKKEFLLCDTTRTRLARLHRLIKEKMRNALAKRANGTSGGGDAQLEQKVLERLLPDITQIQPGQTDQLITEIAKGDLETDVKKRLFSILLARGVFNSGSKAILQEPTESRWFDASGTLRESYRGVLAEKLTKAIERRREGTPNTDDEKALLELLPDATDVAPLDDSVAPVVAKSVAESSVKTLSLRRQRIVHDLLRRGVLIHTYGEDVEAQVSRAIYVKPLEHLELKSADQGLTELEYALLGGLGGLDVMLANDDTNLLKMDGDEMAEVCDELAELIHIQETVVKAKEEDTTKPSSRKKRKARNHRLRRRVNKTTGKRRSPKNRKMKSSPKSRNSKSRNSKKSNSKSRNLKSRQ